MTPFGLSAPITIDYGAMAKKDLLEIAAGLGIGGLSGKMLKADIIAAIRGGETI